MCDDGFREWGLGQKESAQKDVWNGNYAQNSVQRAGLARVRVTRAVS